MSSVSIGCFSAVMSLKVRRNNTTRSLSFFMGAICSSSHSGVSVTRSHIITRHFEELLKLGGSFDCEVISLLWIQLSRGNAAILELAKASSKPFRELNQNYDNTIDLLNTSNLGYKKDSWSVYIGICVNNCKQNLLNNWILY